MPDAATLNFPTLSTDRLLLRAVTPDDAPAFRSLLSVPEVTRHSDWPDSPSEEGAIELVREMSARFPEGRGCAWIIENRAEDRVDGAFLGAVRINYIHRGWQCGGVGYELHPTAWGRGLMTEALRAVVACAHGRFALHQLDAWILPENAASARVLAKAGFREEGLLRERAWFKGRRHDLRIFGRVAGDPLA